MRAAANSKRKQLMARPVVMVDYDRNSCAQTSEVSDGTYAVCKCDFLLPLPGSA